MSAYAFDFFNTLDTYAGVREIARALFSKGQEVHVVSAISPGLPMDYEGMLKSLDVPFTAIHRVDHDPKLKVEVLLRIEARGFWDDLFANVDAARRAGIPSCQVGVEPCTELRTHKNITLPRKP